MQRQGHGARCHSNSAMVLMISSAESRIAYGAASRLLRGMRAYLPNEELPAASSRGAYVVNAPRAGSMLMISPPTPLLQERARTPAANKDISPVRS